ncbi:hypothetical protein DMH01_40840 [Amycolatopsis sp. WAC 04182]|uniref:hypothetical protein n=1 Tax=Amycolatopsis sp. WAC 04182 TaxID=2203198 RepID=UPI000F785715|nr:hypothetical protein [Amycolatopsis sp. WAC 04182]RSN52534.1 hypothetical protein DMH01_40840 [Amycolatopsis sp. WAC 04182]
MTCPGLPDQQNTQSSTVKPGVAIGILVAVIVLVAFCITGFAAPGFLLRKGPGISLPAPLSSPTTTSAPTSTTESPTSTRVNRPSRPRITITRRPVPPPEKGIQVVADFVSKIAAGDKPAAIALACEAQKRFMDDKIDSLLPLGSRVQITNTGGTAKFVLADVAGVVEGRSVRGTVIADRTADGGFCITTFSIRDAR